MEMLSTLAPALVAGLVALVVSLITALFIRRSNKEANETNTFKVVTDQLFALNDELREKIGSLETKLKEVEKKFEQQQKELDAAKSERDTARRVNAGLAAYIKKLLAAWPFGTTPPSPDAPLDWEAHL